jgi:hypothetical protein
MTRAEKIDLLRAHVAEADNDLHCAALDYARYVLGAKLPEAREVLRKAAKDYAAVVHLLDLVEAGKRI